ncbi:MULTISPECIES: HEAT repeat domain-containing protein [Afifella]|uniref:HEAT repeat domain-containing protein n=1 Tax=Afifella TaxID=643217 RepID=UPI000FE41D67|nr:MULTISPECIES: HEAT repeat domain-containing protein [Afifella]MCT8266258.1 HEAT repeat domain-containing protein [Afifella sp. JA880]
MLYGIWNLSIALALASILILLGLIVLRIADMRLAARRAAQRKRFVGALIRFSADEDEASLRQVIAETPKRILVDAGFEFLAMLRGDERARIEEVFAEAGVPDYIRRRLRRANEAERIFAAETLAAFPSEATIAALNRSLGDRAREVRLAAAISLNRLGRTPSLAELMATIGERGQRSRRLVELLRTFPLEKAPELVEFAAREDASSFSRAAAIEALSHIGDPQFMPFFSRLAADAKPEVAAAAVRGLGRFGHPSVLPTVLAATKNGDWQVRYEAAEVAAAFPSQEMIEPLAALLSDAEWSVRYAAAKGLKNLGAAGRDRLLAFATGTASRGQRTASMVLQEGSRA